MEEDFMPNKIQILIVDDETDITGPLSEQLTLDGYDVTTANAGKKAIELIASHKYNIVILDLVLPEIDGFEILKLIKKNHPSTKVIILTGHPYAEYIAECRKQGADDIIEKPSELGDIFDAIQYVLRK